MVSYEQDAGSRTRTDVRKVGPMIGRDEPMVLTVTEGRLAARYRVGELGEPKVTRIYLGYATLDGNEYEQARILAASMGAHISIDVCENEEVKDFKNVLQRIEKAIK